MMFYVYILKSETNGYIYVGSTGNLNQRLEYHNTGKVKSTKAYKPWILMEHEEYGTRSEAMRREMFLKTGQQKEKLRKKYGAVAKW